MDRCRGSNLSLNSSHRLIPAQGALLQPQSFLRNWDLGLSLSGTPVLNMISGPPAVLSPPKKLKRERHQKLACAVFRVMSIQPSTDIPTDSCCITLGDIYSIPVV